MRIKHINADDWISGSALACIILCISSPFTRVVIAGKGISVWAVFAAIVLMLFHIIREPRNSLRIKKPQIIYIGITLLYLASIAWLPTAVSDFALSNIKVQVGTIIIFLYCINKKEEKALLVALYGMAAFMIWCSFFSSIYFYSGIRKYIVLQGMTIDPNYTSAVFIPPIIYSVYQLIKESSVAKKVAHVVFLGLSLYSIFVCGSRGSFFAILIGCLIVYFREVNLSGRGIATIVGSIAIIILLLFIVRNNISTDLINRMTVSSVVETGGSGRVDIISDHVAKFFRESNILNLLFGYGKNSCKLLLGITSHNTAIDFMWDLGLFGFLIYIASVIWTFRYCWKSQNTYVRGLMFATFFWSMTLSANDLLQYWCLIYICICLANNSYSQLLSNEGK